ncbi:MAG: hypothetical protein UT44_C0037G0003 [Candidatus Levybacteria bacterium GW2011_GWA1_39_32]|nr:MAG: hypothetical protein UT44_C0037G0003 [Candidatus Levybacteria bacterium GW2011_GWA1_39_32]
MRIKLFLFFYLAVITSLFFYSFTQVDLSLTLSQSSIWQVIQKQFQHIGFFERATSTYLYTIIVSLLFVFYFIFLYLARKKKIDSKTVWVAILFAGILESPFIHKALDYGGDPMLNFMRWTHRTYPYGPTWLGLTVPLSFLGMNYFLPTFFLFKFLISASFIGSCYMVYKISGKLFPEDRLFHLSFWALNPLVLIEGLVSSHNDMPMIFLTLSSIYLFILRKRALSLVSYVLSVGVKYSTAFLLPVALWLSYLEKKKKPIDWNNVFIALTSLSVLAMLLASIRTNFQPWYLLPPLSFATFISKRPYVLVPSLVLSIAGVLVYAAYVYLTDYNKDYPTTVSNIEAAGFALAALLTVVIAMFGKTLRTKLLR